MQAEYARKVDGFVPTPEKREEETNEASSSSSESETGIATFVDCSYSFVEVESGEDISGTFVGSGNGRDEKGNYAAITGAIKYILTSNFLVPTGVDPENDK